MAKKFWQIVNGGADIDATADPVTFNVAQMQADLPKLQEVETLSDELRAVLAVQGLLGLGIPAQSDLASFDSLLTDEIERLQDLLDYVDYETKQETIFSVADGAWYEPEAVEAVSAEEEGAAILAIDGDNATGWRTNATPASITFRLRSYRKNVESIRLWIPALTLPTELQGLTIRASQALSQIDEPQNVVKSGLNLVHSVGAAFQEIPWDFKKRCRFIKLDIEGSNHVGGDVMIRSIEARVTTFQHSK